MLPAKNLTSSKFKLNYTSLPPDMWSNKTSDGQNNLQPEIMDNATQPEEKKDVKIRNFQLDLYHNSKQMNKLPSTAEDTQMFWEREWITGTEKVLYVYRSLLHILGEKYNVIGTILLKNNKTGYRINSTDTKGKLQNFPLETESGIINNLAINVARKMTPELLNKYLPLQNLAPTNSSILYKDALRSTPCNAQSSTYKGSCYEDMKGLILRNSLQDDGLKSAPCEFDFFLEFRGNAETITAFRKIFYEIYPKIFKTFALHVDACNAYDMSKLPSNNTVEVGISMMRSINPFRIGTNDTLDAIVTNVQNNCALVVLPDNSKVNRKQCYKNVYALLYKNVGEGPIYNSIIKTLATFNDKFYPTVVDEINNINFRKPLPYDFGRSYGTDYNKTDNEEKHRAYTFLNAELLKYSAKVIQASTADEMCREEDLFGETKKSSFQNMFKEIIKKFTSYESDIEKLIENMQEFPEENFHPLDPSMLNSSIMITLPPEPESESEPEPTKSEHLDPKVIASLVAAAIATTLCCYCYGKKSHSHGDYSKIDNMDDDNSLMGREPPETKANDVPSNNNVHNTQPQELSTIEEVDSRSYGDEKNSPLSHEEHNDKSDDEAPLLRNNITMTQNNSVNTNLKNTPSEVINTTDSKLKDDEVENDHSHKKQRLELKLHDVQPSIV